MIKQITVLAGIALFITSCALKEEVHISTNNSIQRDMLVNLDTVAAGKLQAIAAMAGQQEQLKFDSIGVAWDSVGSSLTRLIQGKDGAKASYTPWNRQKAEGALHFSLPDIAAYNEFAGSTLSTPGAIADQIPFGGPKKQQLQWHGKDTLVIALDNSKSPNAPAIPNEAEIKQSLGMVKMMLGVNAIIQYNAIFHLPRPARSIIGNDATLSDDKKSITIKKALEDANLPNQPDQIIVIF